MKPRNILVVDDEEEMRVALSEALTRSGHKVTSASNGEEGFKYYNSGPVDLVISDVRMPRMSGLDFLHKVREQHLHAPFVLITAYGSIDDAVVAMKEGATDYLLKPFSADTLDNLIKRIFEPNADLAMIPERKRGAFTKATSPLSKTNMPRTTISTRPIITSNGRMKEALDIVDRVAASKSTALIHGESGVGKELIARYIHENSDRRDAKFVAVNCAAIPESLLESELFGHEKGSFTGAVNLKIGKFEQANGGTILLDEITEMDSALQAKLLRVLQENEIDRVGGHEPIPLDIRVVATTNRDMGKAVDDGKFREDLFFRLNVIPLHIPPLRERKDDIPLLINFFIDKFNASMGKSITGVEPDVLDTLKQRYWRGNVRELENIMERAVLLASEEKIVMADLMLDKDRGLTPRESKSALTGEEVTRPGMTVADMEKRLIERTLDASSGNRTKAARTLGVSIRTLRNKLNEYKKTHP